MDILDTFIIKQDEKDAAMLLDQYLRVYQPKLTHRLLFGEKTGISIHQLTDNPDGCALHIAADKWAQYNKQGAITYENTPQLIKVVSQSHIMTYTVNGEKTAIVTIKHLENTPPVPIELHNWCIIFLSLYYIPALTINPPGSEPKP